MNIIEPGMRFGRLQVVEKSNKIGRHTAWLCKCDCGNEIIAKSIYLTTGDTKSCGCLKAEKTLDLIGRKFGKLTVIEKSSERTKNNSILWLCKCDCGNLHKAVQGNLLKGSAKSCGCIRKAKINSIKNTYFDKGEYLLGITNTGVEFKIDKEDFDKVKRYSWVADKNGYLMAQVGRKGQIRLHRLILNVGESQIIDHINHDVTDNRKANLRICTTSQNAMNKKLPSNNTSGHKGVYFCNTRKKWIAIIGVMQKRIYLGGFENKQDAITARERAEVIYFGEFAYKESEKQQ
jgi:hypothetical protein